MTTSDPHELLGVRPGISRQELKVAYRDLTKVWHPDRFAHDPRLQEKAQEKLKEINDAYEQLISGKTRHPRMARSARGQRNGVRDRSEQSNSYSPVVVSRKTHLIWFLVPLIVFGSVFLLTIRFLLNKGTREVQVLVEQRAVETGVGSSTETKANDTGSDRRSDGPSLIGPPVIEQQPLPTTTVTIDPITGLLAHAECPKRIRMTYPSGNEPRAYCNVHHADGAASNPQHQSKLKSLQTKTDSPTDELEKNPPEP